MIVRRLYSKLPRHGFAVLAVVAIAAFAAVACSSDAEPTSPTQSPQQATQAPATNATSTPTPPRTLQIVRSYDPAGLPAFTLPRAGGGELNSADYIGRQAVAVIFYRGFF